MKRGNGKKNGDNGTNPFKRKNFFQRSIVVKRSASEQKQARLRELEKIGHAPTRYRGDHTDRLVYRLALLGATDRQMADALEVTEECLNKWKLKHPTFVQSIIDGKEFADSKVAESLFQRALGYNHPDIHISIYKNKETGEIEKVITPSTKYYPPDTTACIFWLKNRQREHWRDVLKREVSGPDGKPIQHEHNVLHLDLNRLTDQELKMVENIGLAMGEKDIIDVTAKQLTNGEELEDLEFDDELD